MLIGIDSCKDADRVYHAYNDRDNVTHEFIIHGLRHANEIMGETVFDINDWEAIGEYDKKAGRHHAFVAPLKDVVIDGLRIPRGERVRIEESYKYSRDEILELWEKSRLTANTVFPNSRGDYGELLTPNGCDKTDRNRPSSRLKAPGILSHQARAVCCKACPLA